MSDVDIRALVLEVIDDLVSKCDSLQAAGVLQEASRRLPRRDRAAERALLTAFYDLFRTGYLSWGHDLANSSPPWCHVTVLGRQALALRSRDPANPDGYLAHLRDRVPLGPVTDSYITEALNTFNAACFKATAAVMVGAAAESLVLNIRDALVARLQALGQKVPADLTDWRVKRVLASLETLITAKRTGLPVSLFERFAANWPAFTHQIRTARNEAGHPVTVEPVTAEEVHASLLIFPELATLAKQIQEWDTHELFVMTRRSVALIPCEVTVQQHASAIRLATARREVDSSITRRKNGTKTARQVLTLIEHHFAIC